MLSEDRMMPTSRMWSSPSDVMKLMIQNSQLLRKKCQKLGPYALLSHHIL